MDSVLYKITEIDKKAQEINSEAQLIRKRLPVEIEGERQRLLKLAEERAVKELAVITAEYQEREQQKNIEIEEGEKQQTESLRTIFKENMSKWENEIYEDIRKK